MKIGKFGEIILEEDEEKWLRKHFPNTKNDDIQERFSKKWGRPMTFSTLHRLARKYGLKKTTRFTRKMSKNAADAAYEVNVRNGFAAQKESMRRLHESGKSNKFKKGETGVDRWGKKKEAMRLKKAGDSRRKRFYSEKIRKAAGLPQKTALYVPDYPLSRRQTCYRSNMLKKGYIVVFRDEELRLTIFYDENTVRHPIAERNAPKYGMKVEPLPADL